MNAMFGICGKILVLLFGSFNFVWSRIILSRLTFEVRDFLIGMRMLNVGEGVLLLYFVFCCYYFKV